MTTYISLLRGINVGGKKPIKMEQLKLAYEALGFLQVSTYVQSGNVIFNSSLSDPEQIATKIAQQIKDTFELEVPIIILSLEQLKAIVEQNPLINQEREERHLHVTFLSSKANHYDQNAIEIKKDENEVFCIKDSVVYLYCPQGYGQTKLNTNFLEKKLNSNATTRNWKTSLELLKMASQQS